MIFLFGDGDVENKKVVMQFGLCIYIGMGLFFVMGLVWGGGAQKCMDRIYKSGIVVLKKKIG